MSLKLKALGLGLLAIVAAGAVAVMNASAESQPTGHFTSEVSHTVLDVNEGPGTSHQLELGIEGFTPIVCDEASYVSTINAATVEHISVAPTYKKCHTTESATETVVTVNGCTYTFTRPNKKSATTENTADLVCPTGQKLVIDHEGCEITIAPQTIQVSAAANRGIGYTTTVENGVHAITLTAVARFTIELHTGICQLIGTNKIATLSGSATISGTDTEGHFVGITATGSES